MAVSGEEARLLAALEDGLAFAPRPYARIAAAPGTSEAAVIAGIEALVARGIIRRFGVVVRHLELGYRANAMVVWQADPAHADETGARLAALPFVTLAYRRTPRPPLWPYNLYCMIHGQDRAAVALLVEEATVAAGLTGAPREVLFSTRRFKQRGARYADRSMPAEASHAG